MKNLVKLGVVALALVPFHAQAATGNIPFSGAVADTCVITVGAPGTLGANTGFTTLGSEEAGGVAGTASVLATGTGFDLSADAPTAWDSAPAGGATSVTWAANYASAGANTIAQTGGATTTNLANIGVNNVTIHMSGTKGSGVLPTGSYSANVVLR